LKFSLLYKDAERSAEAGEKEILPVSEKTLYDLSIDRTVKELSRDRVGCEYVLRVLREPLMNAEDIRYRQDILLDLIRLPGLFDELKDIFKNYDTMLSDWSEMSMGVYSYGLPMTDKGVLDAAYDNLRITAAFLRRTAGCFDAVYDAVEKYDVRSDGLSGIKAFCRRMADSRALETVSDICSLFQRENYSSYRFEIAADTDDAFMIRSAEFTKVEQLQAHGAVSQVKRLIGAMRLQAGSAQNEGTDLGEYHARFSRELLKEAMYGLYTVMSSAAGNLYDVFSGISDELRFYEAALGYVLCLKRSGTPMCMPEILPPEAGVWRAEGIYDPRLLLDGTGGENVAVNDVDLSGLCGAVIRGENSTGKTCALRAVGTAQLFAQAGLPLCAAKAEISICSGVFTQFSSAEKELEAFDRAGRFEGEVRDIAEIMDALTPHSLVLLNESFQTTSYAEGASGMENILEAIGACESRFLFVTHMPEHVLKAPKNSAVLYFGGDHKITEEKRC
jgi:hypothetical protein